MADSNENRETYKTGTSDDRLVFLSSFTIEFLANLIA